MKEARTSLWEVVIGIWLLALIVILAGVFFVPNPLAYVLGEVVGSATATGLMFQLYHSIDIELDLPKKKAVAHSRFMGITRSIVELVVLFGSFFATKWILPYTVFAGLLARKPAALMVPWMEKLRTYGNKTGSQTDCE
jgi:hypothetical protein